MTPLLLGGYAAICGMDQADVSCADRVLAAIYRHGRVTVADLAVELELSEEDVLEACALCWAGAPSRPGMRKGEALAELLSHQISDVAARQGRLYHL